VHVRRNDLLQVIKEDALLLDVDQLCSLERVPNVDELLQGLYVLPLRVQDLIHDVLSRPQHALPPHETSFLFRNLRLTQLGDSECCRSRSRSRLGRRLERK
jgi:hypothetical protein